MRCARCKRPLMKPIEIGGMFYGPICAKKVGGSDEPAQKPLVYRKAPPECIMGYRENQIAHVVDENGMPIDPRLDEVNHSPTGLEWGYGGSGPAQCAYAIARLFLLEEKAKSCYQKVKGMVICKFDKEGWTISLHDLCAKVMQCLVAIAPEVNDDAQVIITYDDAVKMLPDGDNIHTFMNPGTNMLVGADWSRDDVLKLLRTTSEIHITGAHAQRMDHGIAARRPTGDFLFIQTRKVTA